MTEQQAAETGIDGQVACRAAVDSIPSQIHLAVSYSCRVKQVCSRCLKEYLHPIAGECRLVLQELNRETGEAVNDEDVDFYYNSDDEEVDIRGAVYDEIVIGLPMMPLCSPDCAGIEAPSSEKASDNEIDPRWEALRKLKGQ